jgi:hypothetical protein
LDQAETLAISLDASDGVVDDAVQPRASLLRFDDFDFAQHEARSFRLGPDPHRPRGRGGELQFPRLSLCEWDRSTCQGSEDPAVDGQLGDERKAHELPTAVGAAVHLDRSDAARLRKVESHPSAALGLGARVVDAFPAPVDEQLEPGCDALVVLPLPERGTWQGPLTTVSVGDSGLGEVLDPDATLHISFDDPGYRDCALRVPAHVQWTSDALTFEAQAFLELTATGGSLVAYVAPGSLQTTLDVPALDRFESVSETVETVWCELALDAGSGELPATSGMYLNLELTAETDDAQIRLTWARIEGGPEPASKPLPVACGQLTRSSEP